MRFRFAFVALSLLLLQPHTAYAATSFAIETNLSLGSSGAAVTTLQKILNRDPETRIAATGPGALGQETTYFGGLTKAAVIRFQEKYAGEVLRPAGLSVGTGFVGALTRAKLRALESGAPTDISVGSDYRVTPNEKVDIYATDTKINRIQEAYVTYINTVVAAGSTASATPPSVTVSDAPTVIIQRISKQIGAAGTRVSIGGTGFSSKSVVYFGNEYLIRSVSVDPTGTSLSFVVPDIPKKRYDVVVKTAAEISNTVMFIISDPTNPAVTIDQIAPSVVQYGDTITITGSGFTKENNFVITPYERHTGVPSPDGKTLTVQVGPPALRESARIGRGNKKVVSSVTVINDYGFSDGAISFTMNI